VGDTRARGKACLGGMPADRSVVFCEVRKFAVLALEDVLVIGGMRRGYCADEPHRSSATWALGVRRHPDSHFYTLPSLHRTVEEVVHSFRGIVLQELIERSQAAGDYRQHAGFTAWFVRAVHLNVMRESRTRSQAGLGIGRAFGEAKNYWSIAEIIRAERPLPRLQVLKWPA
jgi:hypothetical protein